MNLNDRNSVRNGLNNLLQTKVNFKGMNIPISGLAKVARPFIGKIAPIVEKATGCSVDTLLGELDNVNGRNARNEYVSSDKGENLYDKYKNL